MITNSPDILKVDQTPLAKGPFSGKTVDVIIPFYNEEGNVAGAHQSAARLEALFQIKHFIYINNGSVDGTPKELTDLAEENPKVKIIHIEENKGYGHGFIAGFSASTAHYVITNHADQQFDAKKFYTDILNALNTLAPGYSVFSIRKGRPFAASLMTHLLRMALSAVLGTQLKEFNGQPKLIDRSSLTQPMDAFPNDFSFDLMLYLASGDKKFYPILEQERATGQSSWNRGLLSKYRLFKAYLASARKMKNLNRKTANTHGK